MTTGTITQVAGPVVDVHFEPGQLPKIKEVVLAEVDGEQRVMEVSQHIGGDTVRCVMLAGSEGLYRGMRVTAPGHSITVPVGSATLAACSTCSASPSTAADPLPGTRSA